MESITVKKYTKFSIIDGEIFFIYENIVKDITGKVLYEFDKYKNIRNIYKIYDRILIYTGCLELYYPDMRYEKYIPIPYGNLYYSENIFISEGYDVTYFFKIDKNFNLEKCNFYLDFGYSKHKGEIQFINNYFYISVHGGIDRYKLNNSKFDKLPRLKYDIDYEPIFTIFENNIVIVKKTEDWHLLLEIYYDDILSEVLDFPEIYYRKYMMIMKMDFNYIYILVNKKFYKISYGII